MRAPRIFSITLFLLVAIGNLNAGLIVQKLRCEYLSEPVIDVTNPRLSWILTSPDRGQSQTAYRILAASSPQLLESGAGNLWDSGKVLSDQTIHVPYSGKTLTSRSCVYWKVQAWDSDGHASPWSKPAKFSIGLLKPDDWTAKWIASPASLTNKSDRGPINGFHSDLVHSSDSTQWVAIHLSRPESIDSVRLFPARPYDWQPDTPGFLFPLRFKLEFAEQADFSDAKTVLDRTGDDQPNPGTNAVTFSFPPPTARHIRLTVSRLRERDKGNYAFALSEMQLLSKGTNLAIGGMVTASSSIETGAWSRSNLVDGILQTVPAAVSRASLPATMFRKAFNMEKPVKRATAYVTGLGLYELHINGHRVGDHLLAPEWTDYRKHIQYQVFDVTRLLQKGGNAIGALLSEGWYAGRLFSVGRFAYGTVPQFLLQLEIETTDGQKQIVTTDDSWLCTVDGPIRSASIYDGEEYDARNSFPGWDEPQFNDATWQKVAVLPSPAAALVAQANEPIRAIQELQPINLTNPRPGTWIYDLGQNLVGWCRFSIHAPAGTRIRLRHGEMLSPDGTLYTANLRGAAQVDYFVTHGGGEEAFEPHFTYHGFRYVEITGAVEPPVKKSLTAKVFYSSAPDSGKFESANPRLNQLVRNIYWTQRGNLLSSPTDCPQRDERFGWMGDIQAFSQTSIFNMDMAAFFTKWLRDVRDDQADDGRYPDFAPHPGDPNRQFSGVPAWGDAGTVVPWRMYENYADLRLLSEHFDSARRWVDYIHNLNPDLIWAKGRNNDYNDWLNGDTLIQNGWPRSGGAVPHDVFATAFFAHSIELVAKMARVLKRYDDAKKYSELFDQIKTAFNQRFVSEDGHIQGDTQAGYALALNFNLLPENLRTRAVNLTLQNIQKYHGHLSTGIQSSHRLMLELSRSGHHAEAYRVINLTDFPSWGMMLQNGATTIWERWDGYVKGRGFQDPGMNSFNHWAFGAVGEWIWRELVGINPNPENPGYKHFIIAPKPAGDLNWVRASYDSIRGPISVEWRKNGNAFDLAVDIPANTTATVYLPATRLEGITESGHNLASINTVTFQNAVNGIATLTVTSGHYKFRSRAN